jgi:hypothetical protein
MAGRGTNSQLHAPTARITPGRLPHHLQRCRRLILILPITLTLTPRPPHRWPPRRVAPPPEGPRAAFRAGQRPAVDPRHADASARPSKKPDVSSDKIGAAFRLPRVAVNRSELGSTCALPLGAGARATRVAVGRGYKCPAPHPEQVSSPPLLFLPLAAAAGRDERETASTSRAAGSD